MTLSQALRPLTEHGLSVEKAWGDASLKVPVRASFNDTLEELTIQRLLQERLLRHPYFAFAVDGWPIPAEEVTESRRIFNSDYDGYLDREKAAALLADGATAIFDRADHWIGALARVTADIADAYRGSCAAVVFYTPANSQGLTWHRDGSHVIAVQISGTKTWSVERQSPGERWRPGQLDGPPPDAKIDNYTLARGDALYMPPGVAHSVHTTDQDSTHLTLIISALEMRPLLQAIFAQAGKEVQTSLAERGYHRSMLATRTQDGRVERVEKIITELTQVIERIDAAQLLATVEDQAMKRSGRPF